MVVPLPSLVHSPIISATAGSQGNDFLVRWQQQRRYGLSGKNFVFPMRKTRMWLWLRPQIVRSTQSLFAIPIVHLRRRYAINSSRSIGTICSEIACHSTDIRNIYICSTWRYRLSSLTCRAQTPKTESQTSYPIQGRPSSASTSSAPYLRCRTRP